MNPSYIIFFVPKTNLFSYMFLFVRPLSCIFNASLNTYDVTYKLVGRIEDVNYVGNDNFRESIQKVIKLVVLNRCWLLLAESRGNLLSVIVIGIRISCAQRQVKVSNRSQTVVSIVGFAHIDMLPSGCMFII